MNYKSYQSKTFSAASHGRMEEEEHYEKAVPKENATF